MTFEEYEQVALHTYKPGRTEDGVPRVLGHAGKLAGEAGEVCELIFKDEFHRVPYKTESILKELGDVLWYVTALAHDHGLTLSEVAKENNRKLMARYPNGFVHGGGMR